MSILILSSLPDLTSPALAPVLSQMNPVHTSSPHFPGIRSNIIFPSLLGLPSVSSLQVFQPHNVVWEGE